MSAQWRVELSDWPVACAEASPLRMAVFVLEQGVPEELELDEFDPVSCHALARDPAGTLVGTGRLLPDGHIGRMAVRADCRGLGVGRVLMDALVGEARRRGLARVVLNAQLTALPFYERLGFVAEGPVFDDAGLPHRCMQLPLLAG